MIYRDENQGIIKINLKDFDYDFIEHNKTLSLNYIKKAPILRNIVQHKKKYPVDVGICITWNLAYVVFCYYTLIDFLRKTDLRHVNKVKIFCDDICYGAALNLLKPLCSDLIEVYRFPRIDVKYREEIGYHSFDHLNKYFITTLDEFKKEEKNVILDADVFVNAKSVPVFSKAYNLGKNECMVFDTGWGMDTFIQRKNGLAKRFRTLSSYISFFENYGLPLENLFKLKKWYCSSIFSYDVEHMITKQWEYFVHYCNSHEIQCDETVFFVWGTNNNFKYISTEDYIGVPASFEVLEYKSPMFVSPHPHVDYASFYAQIMKNIP